MRSFVLALPALLALSAAGVARADVINVPGDQPTIQAGIDAAVNGDEVVLADGLYTGAGNVNLSFGGKAITVRSASGDPSQCVIDCQDAADTRGFLFDSGEPATAVLDGLTITNGHMTGSGFNGVGGAIHVLGSNPTIANCAFSNNAANTQGGAIRIGGDSSPILMDCVFAGNAVATDGTGGGGAVAYVSNGTVTIKGCTFMGNSASGGGAVSNGAGPGLVLDCLFVGNVATFKGGGFSGARDTVVNCVFSGNVADQRGGAVSMNFAGEFINCTMVANSAGASGGGLYADVFGFDTPPNVTNCILRSNSPDQVDFLDEPPVVTFSNVEGGFAGTGNIDADAMLCDPDGADDMIGTPDDDPSLCVESPSIDAGDNTAVPPEVMTDIIGNPRFFDDLVTPDSGNGTAPIVDMGAYEYPGDCNGNGVPDFEDIARGTSEDCNGNEIPDECETDCNGNGVPDDCDIFEGAASDCNGNEVPDECDIDSGESDDCNANAIPDECELADGTAFDCNDNGILDVCDIADGTSTDCDANGVLDECETVAFDGASDLLSPIGTGVPQSWTFVDTPEAGIDGATFTFEATGDFASGVEFIDVDINGVVVGTVFVDTAGDCPMEPDVEELVVAPETFNEAVMGGDATITMTASAAVDPNPALCTSSISVALSYQSPTPADPDGNGVPDACETCPGDIDGDDVVGTSDLLALLAGWGPNPGHAADLDGDDVVGTSDLLELLANWGPCP